MAASENYLLSVSSLTEAGGGCKTPSMELMASLGQPFTMSYSTSQDYSFEYGPFVAPEAIELGPGPVVFGVGNPFGQKLGGDAAVVYGFNLGLPGSFTEVRLGDKNAIGPQVRTNTSIALTTPPGQNSYGNPLGVVPVSVSNDVGAFSLPDAYVYFPALMLEHPAHMDGPVQLRYVGRPNTSVKLACGVRGPGAPWGLFDGMWELLPGWNWVGRELYAPNGDALLQIQIPESARYIGATIDFQALALNPTPKSDSTSGNVNLSVPAGAFTNRLTVKVLP